MLGVSIDRERAFVGEFLADLGVALPSYWDGEGVLTGDMLGARKIPLTVVIDREGRVMAGHEGARDWSAPEMVAAVRGLAEGDAPAAERVTALLRELR